MARTVRSGSIDVLSCFTGRTEGTDRRVRRPSSRSYRCITFTMVRTCRRCGLHIGAIFVSGGHDNVTLSPPSQSRHRCRVRGEG